MHHPSKHVFIYQAIDKSLTRERIGLTGAIHQGEIYDFRAYIEPGGHPRHGGGSPCFIAVLIFEICQETGLLRIDAGAELFKAGLTVGSK